MRRYFVSYTYNIEKLNKSGHGNVTFENMFTFDYGKIEEDIAEAIVKQYKNKNLQAEDVIVIIMFFKELRWYER